MKRVMTILLTVLTVMMLLAMAVLMPQGSMSNDARLKYINESVDDEYDFL